MRRRIAILAVFFMITALFSGVTSAPANAQVVTSVTAAGGDTDNYNNHKKPVKRPAIIGTTTVGSTVSVTMGVWKPHVYWWSPYWYRLMPDGTKKLLSKKLTYKIKPADKGFKLVVLVNAYHQNYEGHVFTKPRLVK